jgi:hypothetical protein
MQICAALLYRQFYKDNFESNSCALSGIEKDKDLYKAIGRLMDNLFIEECRKWKINSFRLKCKTGAKKRYGWDASILNFQERYLKPGQLLLGPYPKPAPKKPTDKEYEAWLNAVLAHNDERNYAIGSLKIDCQTFEDNNYAIVEPSGKSRQVKKAYVDILKRALDSYNDG